MDFDSSNFPGIREIWEPFRAIGRPQQPQRESSSPEMCSKPNYSSPKCNRKCSLPQRGRNRLPCRVARSRNLWSEHEFRSPRCLAYNSTFPSPESTVAVRIHPHRPLGHQRSNQVPRQWEEREEQELPI
ncbi:hypothetical protein PENTCL1PPCAC_12369, partial [Pristionchus entomophagus]